MKSASALYPFFKLFVLIVMAASFLQSCDMFRSTSEPELIASAEPHEARLYKITKRDVRWMGNHMIAVPKFSTDEYWVLRLQTKTRSASHVLEQTCDAGQKVTIKIDSDARRAMSQCGTKGGWTLYFLLPFNDRVKSQRNVLSLPNKIEGSPDWKKIATLSESLPMFVQKDAQIESALNNILRVDGPDALVKSLIQIPEASFLLWERAYKKLQSSDRARVDGAMVTRLKEGEASHKLAIKVALIAPDSAKVQLAGVVRTTLGNATRESTNNSQIDRAKVRALKRAACTIFSQLDLETRSTLGPQSCELLAVDKCRTHALSTLSESDVQCDALDGFSKRHVCPAEAFGGRFAYEMSFKKLGIDGVAKVTDPIAWATKHVDSYKDRNLVQRIFFDQAIARRPDNKRKHDKRMGRIGYHIDSAILRPCKTLNGKVNERCDCGMNLRDDWKYAPIGKGKDAMEKFLKHYKEKMREQICGVGLDTTERNVARCLLAVDDKKQTIESTYVLPRE